MSAPKSPLIPTDSDNCAEPIASARPRQGEQLPVACNSEQSENERPEGDNQEHTECIPSRDFAGGNSEKADGDEVLNNKDANLPIWRGSIAPRLALPWFE